MRNFVLDRYKDITGISGTGIIAYGVEWESRGQCDLYWRRTKATGQYPSLEMIESHFVGPISESGHGQQ